MVSFGGEMSLDRYLALEVRAIPFDMAHMIGNVVFALAAGPAMIAALTRFRERFDWRQAEGGAMARTRSATGVAMIGAAALLFTFGGTGATQKAEAAYTARQSGPPSGCKSQQNSDGGFASMPDGTSSVNITARAMFALAAAGINPLDVKTNATPYGYLVNNRQEITDASDIALTILAMKTVGQDPKDFKGRNLIEALREPPRQRVVRQRRERDRLRGPRVPLGRCFQGRPVFDQVALQSPERQRRMGYLQRNQVGGRFDRCRPDGDHRREAGRTGPSDT